jgi:hypothetical protein
MTDVASRSWRQALRRPPRRHSSRDAPTSFEATEINFASIREQFNRKRIIHVSRIWNVNRIGSRWTPQLSFDNSARVGEASAGNMQPLRDLPLQTTS